MAEIEQDVELNLSHYLDALIRRRWIVVLVAVLIFAGAVCYAFFAPPIFRATTVLNIEKANGGLAQNPLVEAQDEEYFTTQFKLITSDTQLRRVHTELKLSETKEFASGFQTLKLAVAVVPVPRTRLCQVNAESMDPMLAMKISAALAQYFVEQNLNNQMFMSKEVLDALQSRMKGDDAKKISESLPSVVNNLLVQDIKGKIFADEATLADLRMKYTDNHPAVLAIKSRLISMRKVLDNEVDNIVKSLKTELSGQLRGNNVRIIDLPQLPDSPVRPRKALALAFGLIGGLALGVFTALIVEALDQTVRTQDDVERELGLPFLGLIPHTRHKKNAKIYAALVSPEVSLTSEAFRNLRTMVGFTEASGGDPCVLVTSTVQEEGKSFVSVNLGVVLAQLGQKVLIVDGDLRRPRLHRNLHASSEKGLSDFLSGRITDIAELVQTTDVPGLEVVTCGPRPPNPAELLNTERLSKFVAWARTHYDRVVVDCPPVFPVSDVLLWGKVVNSAVFVSRFGRTRIPLIKTACARLRVGGLKILGGVVNGARLGTMSYADGRYYEQYYRDYVDTETKEKRS